MASALARMLGFQRRRPDPNAEPPLSIGMKDDEIAALIKSRNFLYDCPTELSVNNSLFMHHRLKQANVFSTIYGGFTEGESSIRAIDRQFLSRFIPTWQQSVMHYQARAFCAQFSNDGETYVVATSDSVVQLYETREAMCTKIDESGDSTSTNQSCRPFKEIEARYVSWAIIDVDYSPNNQFVVYSTWSPYLQLCNVYGAYELHEALHMRPATPGRICFFSVKFDPTGRLLLGGASDYCWYLYDIERKERKLCVGGHTDDINSVAFTDASGNVVLTGSDDRTIRVWDVRVCQSNVAHSADDDDAPSFYRSPHSRPVGSFLGHTEGISCVTSAGDNRLVASNGKDSALKIWDLRAMRSADDAEAYEREPRSDFDYRYAQSMDASQSTPLSTRFDNSLATLRGHRVAETLVRCHFSPAFTTAQRYVYTGSYRGGVLVYDILTGQIAARLQGHSATVRDCSWHPYEPLMLTASWDCSVGFWAYGALATGSNSNEANVPSIRARIFAMQDSDDEEDSDFVPENEEDDDVDEDSAPAEGEEADALLDQDENRASDDIDVDDEEQDEDDDIDVDDETFAQTVYQLLAQGLQNIDPALLLEHLVSESSIPDPNVEEKMDDEDDENVEDDDEEDSVQSSNCSEHQKP